MSFANDSPSSPSDSSEPMELLQVGKRIRHSKRFTKEEDDILRSIARDKRNKTWKEIADMLPGRTATQCRDRYNQYLSKDVVNRPWTPEEDQIIIEKYKIYGPRWVQISTYLNGRSGNNVKNRWNSALTKYHDTPTVNDRKGKIYKVRGPYHQHLAFQNKSPPFEAPYEQKGEVIEVTTNDKLAQKQELDSLEDKYGFLNDLNYNQVDIISEMSMFLF